MVQKTGYISKQVFSSAKRTETQTAKKAMLTSIRKNRDFDMIRHMKPLNENMSMSISQREDASTAAQHMSQKDAQSMGTDVQDVETKQNDFQRFSSSNPRRGTEWRV